MTILLEDSNTSEISNNYCTTLPHKVKVNLLGWKWIDKKFYIIWMYLLCFKLVDTAFLLCGAELTILMYSSESSRSLYMQVCGPCTFQLIILAQLYTRTRLPSVIVAVYYNDLYVCPTKSKTQYLQMLNIIIDTSI